MLAIGSADHCLLFLLHLAHRQAKDLERFNNSTQELTTYVRGRPRLYIEVLRAATGLFAVSPSINPGQFHKFVERLELADQYPGAQGIGFLARVKRDQKDFGLPGVSQRYLRPGHLASGGSGPVRARTLLRTA